MVDRPRVIMVAVGGVVTIAGIVILLIGLRYATGSDVVDESTTTRALAGIFLGAVMFAVGGMTALVGIVRPLFRHRAIDERAKQMQRGPDSRNG